ncbi:hypothetical protein B0H17DRAFT_1144987 [Mycena rosella]|uniref:Uncharacterized protein n=1 Tax=Mycena rosella TaxID=1033263 RepID=A0AAD7CRX2_MYCRO|nr:hypothetical protein B0H17DRAFT_1144987 [Mycena rosella]
MPHIRCGGDTRLSFAILRARLSESQVSICADNGNSVDAQGRLSPLNIVPGPSPTSDGCRPSATLLVSILPALLCEDETNGVCPGSTLSPPDFCRVYPYGEVIMRVSAFPQPRLVQATQQIGSHGHAMHLCRSVSGSVAQRAHLGKALSPTPLVRFGPESCHRIRVFRHQGSNAYNLLRALSEFDPRRRLGGMVLLPDVLRCLALDPGSRSDIPSIPHHSCGPVRNISTSQQHAPNASPR